MVFQTFYYKRFFTFYRECNYDYHSKIFWSLHFLTFDEMNSPMLIYMRAVHLLFRFMKSQDLNLQLLASDERIFEEEETSRKVLKEVVRNIKGEEFLINFFLIFYFVISDFAIISCFHDILYLCYLFSLLAFYS